MKNKLFMNIDNLVFLLFTYLETIKYKQKYLKNISLSNT